VSILTISLTVERARNVFVSNSVRTRMQRKYLSEFCLFFSPSPYALNELTTEDIRNAGNKSKLNNAERVIIIKKRKLREDQYILAEKNKLQM
jgi:hypothetical protein